MSQQHPAFRLIRQQHVKSLNLNVDEYEHIETGAQHIHLSPQSSGDSENVFLVALRTVPHDSTGVAHILEHTALCGSKKYPVRDPFFMMTRRSINTFMNAFTSSDWTAYPFASLNKKDFNNLLDVYLDAVFFSRLDELDFAQEGHRLEFKDASDSSTPLEYKGVVYNEMKGAMSSVPSQLWHSLCKYLFPTTTYHYNSGGDPESIPDLSYEQLQQFYQTHYHPSNAIFMTYGDISAYDHQQKFQDQALNQFERLNYSVAVPDEKRLHATVRVQESYPNTDDDGTDKTHVVIAWLLGKSTNLRDSLRAQLLSSVLLDNSATPLMYALESTDLGNAPSPLCGLDSSQKELSFVCGLAGCKTDSADDVEKLIMTTLEKVAEDGVLQEDIESALHQLELHQREVGGDSYPYGLQLILTSLTNATHRGDPVALLNIDDELEQLREDIKSPDFIKNLTRELILQNKHCVRLTMVPDSEMAARQEQSEKDTLASIKSQLSEQDVADIIQRAADLKERQAAQDDESILPKVTLEDVPKHEDSVCGEVSSLNSTRVTSYSAGTNGLMYQQVIFKLPEIAPTILPHLSLYSSIVTELGAGEHSYLDMQRQQASVSGSFNAYSSIRGTVDSNNDINGYYTFSGKALSRNQAALSDLMHTSIQLARFDEVNRIQELVAQIRVHQEQSITGNGHSLAMMAASAGICATAKLHHQQSGLAAIKGIKALDDAIKNPEQLQQLAQKLADLHNTIISGEKEILVVGEEELLPSYHKGLHSLCGSHQSQSKNDFALATHNAKIHEAWLTNTQVNFCAKSYATVSMDHADAAPLVVLGGFLRNGYLHTAIREQGGAYGGGASQDNNLAAFRFYSYRDPRMQGTLDDFDKALDWLAEQQSSEQKIEEAILGVISGLDKSESPAGRAKRCFHAELHGRTVAHRQKFRERVLNTTLEDLKRVAQTYLTPDKASTAVITSNGQRESAEKIGLEIVEL
ncbi:insulinase family protein [Agarilytica rhodophyticola]|uniref:insulinase family protein n=1 Tax=Agarilytica rhodophyticola TaxID=1737490 RepID=UPI000B34426B|nr:insulinase family protein [Agarilytica rhodophyticola]